MIRRRPSPSVVRLLAALALVASTAAGSPAPVVAGAPDALLLRFAFFAAAAPAAEANAETFAASTKELTQALAGWDLESDRDDVQRLFALHQLNEIARQAAEMPAAGGYLRGTYAVGTRSYAVKIEVRPTPASDIVRVLAEISRDGELIAAPGIVTRLGDRAMLSAASQSGRAPDLFFVVEVAPRHPHE